jgi:predicted ATPase
MRRQLKGVIASVAFQNFKALRNTRLELAPFNLVIGPNGSGKTSLLQAIARLRTLAKLPLRDDAADTERMPETAEITFHFNAPYDGLEAVLACVSDTVCDLLHVAPLPRGEGSEDWSQLRAFLMTARSYLFDHEAIATPAAMSAGSELASNGGHLAAVLAQRREQHPVEFARYTAEVCRVFPEYDEVRLVTQADHRVGLWVKLADGGEEIAAEALSQGTLVTLAILALAFDPTPPAIVCIEEIDRGIHPRLLREIRDALYHLSYPSANGDTRTPVQVIATTHSPYLLDLFRDHPEEVVITEKVGRAAVFTRLSDRADLSDLMAEGSLGDLWFSGVLGGVPAEKTL